MNDFVISVCRAGRCFEGRDREQKSGLSFGVREPDEWQDPWTAFVYGRWPDSPLREGDLLEVSVFDRTDQRVLANASLALVKNSWDPSSPSCLSTQPLVCTSFVASTIQVDFPRACVDRDCTWQYKTVLELEFDPALVLNEVERTSPSPYVARACQDSLCTETQLTWTPESLSRDEFPPDQAWENSIAFQLESWEQSGKLATLKAMWISALGEPGAGSTYSLSLHRGSQATAASSIVERQGPLIRTVKASYDQCVASESHCESFRWPAEG